MSSVPVRRLPRAVREQQMLDAAVRVFSRHGYHMASMDEIAEVAGISKPMVYAYLGTKDALFLACLRREVTRLMEAVAAALPPGAPPDQQLWNGLRAFFGFVGAHRDGWSVLYRQARSQEPFVTEVVAMRERIVGIVTGLLEGATRGSDLRAGPEDLAASAYALVGAAESLADRLSEHPDEDPQLTAARMMNFVWLGARDLLKGEIWSASQHGGPADDDGD